MPACPIQMILKGQKALVTGANSGIGRSIALALAHAGADVVVNYYAGEKAALRVVDEASHCGSRVYAHQADVSQEKEVRDMFERMLDEFGTIDILVNNAGLQQGARLDSVRVECPVGSGRLLNLQQVADELAARLTRIFLPNERGRRPCHGNDRLYGDDPHWRDLLLFHEYFHGDHGCGVGASHQTGWTALVANLLEDIATSPARSN